MLIVVSRLGLYKIKNISQTYLEQTINLNDTMRRICLEIYSNLVYTFFIPSFFFIGLHYGVYF